MKSIYLFVLCWLLSIGMAKAQCLAPTGDSIFSSPAYCPGSGSVTVYSVTGGGAGNTYQYELRYDSVSNTSVAKPYQNDSIFTNVLRGRYKVNIRTVCPGIGVSAPFTSASITVTGTSTPLSVSSVTQLSASACGNGSISVAAAGGNTFSPYQYALVPTQAEPEPVAVYVRPKQSSNTFTDLPAGTYYVRVYDSCGTYATANITVDAVTEAVTLSSDRGGSNFYGCDSLRFRMGVTVNYKRAAGTQLPSERFWVTYAGETDTIPNMFFTYSATTSTASAVIFDNLSPIAYPAVITYGFRSACGNIYTKTDTVMPPVLKIDLLSNAISCTQRSYTIRAKDSLSLGWNYYNTRLSVDSGATWSPLNTNYFYTDTFEVGQTYHLVLASGCDTDRLTVTTIAPAFSFQLNQFNAYSCSGMTGFGISVFNSQFSGNIDSIKFKVLSQPTGANLPDSFYMIQQTGVSGSGNGFRLSYNIPVGTYTLKGTDQCGATATQTIIIAPTTLQYTISPRFSCTPSQSGFTINATQSNYQAYYAFSYLRARVTNMATNQVDSFMSASPMRPASISVSGLANGTYTIQVYPIRPAGYPQACTVDTVYVNTVNQPLSLSQSYFTASCANGTATVSAVALGGGGSYAYSLYKKNGSGVYVLDAGPQASGLFNSLLPSGDYQVRVTDTCGNGTQYATSFETVAPSIFLSTPAAPCPGDPVTFSVPAYPNATFSWLKNNTPIASATNSSYTISSVPATAVDTYKAVVSLGSCIVYTNTYILNPVNCGQPLPVILTSFGGSFTASGQVLLHWEIANADIAAQFVPEYSTDGRTFRQLGVVPAEAAPTYQYQDIFREDSRSYYRLKMLSKDGMSVYSGVIRMDKGATVNEISVYPTVVSTTAHIRYSTAEAEAVQWTLADMQGRMLRSGTFKVAKGMNELNINGLDALAPGTYLLQMKTEASLRYRGKIVVAH